MDGLKFEELIKKQITILRLTSAAHADELQEKLDAYKQFSLMKNAEQELYVTNAKRPLLSNVTEVPGLRIALATFGVILNTPDQLAIYSTNRAFKNIIDALVTLRVANTELDKLLKTIDTDILRLNTEAQAAKVAAEEKLMTDKSTAQKAIIDAEADLEKQGIIYAAFSEKALELMAIRDNVKLTTAVPTDLQAAESAFDTALTNLTQSKAEHEKKKQQLKRLILLLLNQIMQQEMQR